MTDYKASELVCRYVNVWNSLQAGKIELKNAEIEDVIAPTARSILVWDITLCLLTRRHIPKLLSFNILCSTQLRK
jgi:hypothetical protein